MAKDIQIMTLENRLSNKSEKLHSCEEIVYSAIDALNDTLFHSLEERVEKVRAILEGDESELERINLYW